MVGLSPGLRTQATSRFLAVWTQEATVTRPTGPPTFAAGAYTAPTSTVVTRMACDLQTTIAEELRDVAGDPATLQRLELRHDPQYELRVDDTVTFTTHPDASVVGATFDVVGVAQPYQHVYGMALVQRTQTDAGA